MGGLQHGRMAVKSANMYSNVRSQYAQFFLVYVTQGDLNGELIRRKLTRHTWKRNGGGGGQEERNKDQGEVQQNKKCR
jgi:hypothetical protein